MTKTAKPKGSKPEAENNVVPLPPAAARKAVKAAAPAKAVAPVAAGKATPARGRKVASTAAATAAAASGGAGKPAAKGRDGAAAKRAAAEALPTTVETPPATPPSRQRATAARAAKPDDSPVLYQIYYREDQKAALDPEMEPYDNIGNRNPLLEFNVFSTLFKSGKLKDVALWGALSWKFAAKSGLSARELRNIVRANPGFDVYYCNIAPEAEAIYHNLWVQGETAHPEFLDTARAFFKAARLPEEMLSEMQASTQFSTANYFVGSNRFWQRYVAFVETALLLAAKHLPVDLRERLLSSKADPRGVHFGASFLPFIVERLFPVFMATSGRGLKAFRVPLPARQPENVHLQLLRQMKDVAIAKQDRWLAVCWVNYRNLYLDRAHGPEWMKKYAPAITPLAIQFPASWA